MGNKRLKGFKPETNEITFSDAGGVGGGKPKTFKVSDLIATPDYTQAKIFEDAMYPFINNFLQGYNVNFLAYGQTGSGKTYTMLGPVKTFTN